MASWMIEESAWAASRALSMIFGNPLAPRTYQCRSEILSLLLEEITGAVYSPFIDDFTQIGWEPFVL